MDAKDKATKKCKTCDVVQPIENFSLAGGLKYKARYRASYCNTCRASTQRQYHAQKKVNKVNK